jgi:hypothetical protein
MVTPAVDGIDLFKIADCTDLTTLEMLSHEVLPALNKGRWTACKNEGHADFAPSSSDFKLSLFSSFLYLPRILYLKKLVCLPFSRSFWIAEGNKAE